MALFGKTRKPEGGLMDVIRCDQPDYLVWKWRPDVAEAMDESGKDADTTREGVYSTVKENAIRYGSSLRVKEGEVAVFVYPQKDGALQDFIEGPYDGTIKTANFPVLARVAGAFFGGASPFQAEIYFINLAGINQVFFGVPYFDVFDPRFPDLGVPVAVRGIITFRLVDYKAFIKLHRLIDFNKEAFTKQIRSGVSGYIKGVVSNVSSEHQIPVLQLTTRILTIKEITEAYIKPRLENEFGVTVSSVDIEAIEVAKDSEGYQKLMNVTQNLTEQTLKAQTDINIQNMKDTQHINAANMEESLRIQREEAQRAQKLQTEGANFAVHQLNQQAGVAKEAAASLGKMGQGASMGNGGAFNPGAMMAGMAMGGIAGQQMAGMMGNMMQGMNQPPQGNLSVIPPPPNVQYNVAVNGKTTGPFTIEQLARMIQSGQFTGESMIWKAGMANWAAAGTVQELAPLFSGVMPPPPPPPVS
ncbi:MAG: SPFH domain-containing protein [Spirochaetales bacterium]|jgi:membrane protease subunit (stomatin/prohibitin family)|nr:SPFH domain-containing protein [Spirochaetales bacterium]